MSHSHQFAIPTRDFPEELHEWYRSIMPFDAKLRSPEQKVIYALANDRAVLRSLKAKFAELRKHEDWPGCLENYFHEVARLPGMVPMSEFITPGERDRVIQKALSHISALQQLASQHPRLFVAPNSDKLQHELRCFGETLDNRLQSSETMGEYPRYGRSDGENATRNWIATQLSLMSQHHLGARYDTLTAAVATVVSGEDVTESNVRSLVPNLKSNMSRTD